MKHVSKPSTSQGSDRNSEYRPYRRFLAWSVVLFSVLGSLYVLTSVAVTIFRRRNPPTVAATPVGENVTLDEVSGCWEELSDVQVALEKHLESFHHLLARYDNDEAQRWGDEGALWRKRWSHLGQRCRFGEVRTRDFRKHMDEMVSIHDDLGSVHLSYTRELKRFGSEHAPRLSRARVRLESLGKSLNEAQL